jgi:hypothetical protein
MARQYYGDPYQEWLLFLTNNIQDPYGQWYMNPSEFSDFIIQKYGSLTLPQISTMYFTNNWYRANSNISVSAYNALDTDLLKYYEPQFDAYGQIFGYVRVQEDWTLITNYLVSFNFSTNIPNFIIDEIVNINYSNNMYGSGQVVQFSSNNISIQHCNGYFLPNNQVNSVINSSYFSIYGTQSNSTITIANSSDIIINLYQSVANDELVFYDPVTYFQYETNKNESNKIISILQSQYVANTSAQLTKVLQ